MILYCLSYSNALVVLSLSPATRQWERLERNRRVLCNSREALPDKELIGWVDSAEATVNAISEL